MSKKLDIRSGFSLDEEDDSIGFVMPILNDGDSDKDYESGLEDVGDEVPIIALRNMVLFPGVALPVIVARSKSKRLVTEAMHDHQIIGVVSQKDARVDDPGLDDLHQVGVLAEIIRIFELPDGTSTTILQGRKRFNLLSLTENEPYLRGKIEQIADVMPQTGDEEFDLVIAGIRESVIKLMQSNPSVPKDVIESIRANKNERYLVNFSCANFPTSSDDKQMLLETSSLKERAMRLYVILSRMEHLLKLKDSIQRKTQQEIMRQQKDFFLQQQLKTIQEELGNKSEDPQIKELRDRSTKKHWSNEVQAVFEKEIAKLGRLHPQSPEYSVQYEYINTILSLPWNEFTIDNFDLARAERILNRNHYGLEKVKERILEFLSVLKLKGDMKSPILCLYGPPGVGKTSLGKSVAEALGRKYVRMSLGGVHDEAEIRGHRRTYIGAMLGRILRNIQKVGSSNPVFVLDEIDKVVANVQGDPSSALLEVLDPEQNNTFHDNYLDVEYNLSHVMFICTANNLNTISQPLLDRMELIEVPGYITEEKIEIAKRHLVPRQLEENGLPKKSVKFSKNTLQAIIESYTRESGVRELEKKLAKIMRHVAKIKATSELTPCEITPKDLKEYLGVEEYRREKYQGNQYPGVVIGLAWTAVGGEILFVESSLSKGHGGKLTLTGNLGDVMKESAMLALEYIHAHASAFGIPEERFENWNVHIHVPEGAIPKDGPSAGVTMAVSLVSSFTGRLVRPNLAMTGEITLRGKVLPVGGIREKLLAARRAGITDIIICSENRRNVEEIKPDYLAGMTFHYVDDIKEAVDLALLDDAGSKKE